MTAVTQLLSFIGSGAGGEAIGIDSRKHATIQLLWGEDRRRKFLGEVGLPSTSRLPSRAQLLPPPIRQAGLVGEPMQDLPPGAPKVAGDDRQPLCRAHVEPPLTGIRSVDGLSLSPHQHRIQRIILIDSISPVDPANPDNQMPSVN
ncbi:hypothetical protein [Micromonospora avicenniae]|uniref:hypothetical protein n=1 Tax=Micromonospora avicenniae TaxID=1198245 RepID=UPI003448634B